MKLAALFSDHMVLQRDCPVAVWGWGDPGSRIRVEMAGASSEALGGGDGKWQAHLPALPAGGPHTLTVWEVGGDSRIVIRDILVGEVWLCSGQSNMEFPVSSVCDAAREVADATFPAIRLLKVPRVPCESPLEDLCASSRWVECSPETACDFSAVGYFLGRHLHRESGTPVGLINSSWGGTGIESWTSLEGLRQLPSLAPLLAAHEHTLEKSRRGRPSGIRPRPLNSNCDDKNAGSSAGWAGLAPPPGDWREMNLPAKWQERGLDFSGVFWFRRTLTLPAEWAGRALTLSIGAADKEDITYFNNVKVGGLGMKDSPNAYSILREYTIPAGLARQGDNVVAVRVHSNLFDGGLTGPSEAMGLSCPSLPDSVRIPLAGDWNYAVESSLGHRVPGAPSELFNGMIAPLVGFPMRGAIWYQGENNEGNASLYSKQLSVLIGDWRERWKQGDFPFLIVQLPNFGEPCLFDELSERARLREAQMQALRMPRTGMAVTIDIGEAEDNHPKNKQDVGFRLALHALSMIHGREDIVPCGPLFEKCTLEGARMRLFFRHVGSGLESRGGALQGFVLAGADGRFFRANAEIEGDTVLAWSGEVASPEAVRYAWANNPICNLTNREGLPAAPFRTDDWPVSSIGETI